MAENSRALVWRKSRFCGSQSCVEVAHGLDAVLIRDSKDPEAAPLQFQPDAWRDFIAGLRNETLSD
ncbi:DUF397 domain-containing protein [Dactylosporangium matsuzakiense]|uniref:DUF397 domain-containing protein n=1 Tax=Dactylosporangium matsuzakiense TaxID=53360 RepID=A0A9W6KM93_9ACTN|nr:DUF397 domain-containing protein [Dactylosporangium matsuzakiense]UWZ44508.1 DUF397 domain-containing protein [Dactylosporangium matsuzakiense]GLL01899.1 hypothetical protein GCM10017581_036410 [Dactylosporangium matsuzakiense]